MQYNHRSRLLPPPPFGRGGGAGYPRGHKQLYAPPPRPPQHKYEVLMEAGRLAAEYLVSQGVLPPAALQRSAGSAGAWAAPSLPPPPPQLQQQEPPAFYGRRRYDDEYSNNPSARPRRTNGTSSSTSSRDDYSSGSYNDRGKRKYGEYRRGYSDSSRDREKERGRAFSNGRLYEEDEDEDEAPGFRRELRGSRGSVEVRSSVTEAVREEMPLTAKAVGELDIDDTRSKAVSSVEDVQKDADAVPEVQGENEEGEVDGDSKVLNSESEVVEQAINTDATNASTGVELEPMHLPGGKIPEEKADDEKVLDEAALDHNTFDLEVTNVQNNMCDDMRNWLDYCDFARAPTRPRSVRAHKNTAPIPGETSVAETVDLVSSGQASQMVIDGSAEESSLTNIQSENREDQTCQENTNSSVVCDEPMEPMLLQEIGTSVVTENMKEEKGDAHVVQEYMEETDPSPLKVSHKDSLMQETGLSPLTASHKDSFIKETELSPLTVSHKDSLMQETDLSQTMSSHENNLKLQFKEGTQTCDIDMLPQDVDLIKMSDQREIVCSELCPNVGAEAAIELEEGKMDQSSSFKVSYLDLVGGKEVAAIHDNTASATGFSIDSHKKQHEGPETTAGANASATDDICHLPLENKDVQVIDIECDTPIEVGGFGSSKSKNEMICSSMDNMMHPGIHADVLGIQDGYNLAFSDFLGAHIPCYPPMQSDLHAGIAANNSEGVTVMDDPIYGSLTDFDVPTFQSNKCGFLVQYLSTRLMTCTV
ncbi:uncharacterized protein LOC133922008 isoform X2 [Phragmites australis]|uniref:uncharacterized protein LOC133922008 isoform X2 n=1 Tax=Phragmites australis TaxID=29695 RepID=UPI002D77A86A|nr:uncharacterized protein LOC133922008 isoform X2 [Phragmites australis]